MDLISVVEFLVRVYVAAQFMASGVAKAIDWRAAVTQFSHEYSIPLLAPAWAAAACMVGEIGWSLLLIPGVFMRSTCMGLLAINFVAVLFHPAIWDLSRPGPLQNRLYVSAYLLVMIAWGPGRYSLDAQWRR